MILFFIEHFTIYHFDLKEQATPTSSSINLHGLSVASKLSPPQSVAMAIWEAPTPTNEIKLDAVIGCAVSPAVLAT